MFWWVVLGIGALLAGTAIVITVAVLCIEEIINAIREYLREKMTKEQNEVKALSATIEKIIKNGEYTEVNIGLKNTLNQKIDEITIRSTEVKQDFYEGQTIRLSEVY